MEELFNENTLEEFKNEDSFIIIQKMCAIYQDFYRKNIEHHAYDINTFNTALNAYSFLLAFTRKWGFDVKEIDISSNPQKTLESISIFVNACNSHAIRRYSEKIISIASEKYNLMFGNEFFYEIQDEDFNRIQILINELRDLIKNSEDITEEQKGRLLKRLEQLQVELNKRVSNFDRYWGVIIEISSNIGQVCENLKPLNDRLKELIDIITRVMKITSGAFLLEPINDSKLLKSPDTD